jgi:diguanylate cyclase (GGDEF)-like protein/PAS domain S-box-containing protein
MVTEQRMTPPALEESSITSHPMDTSRVLLSMLELVRQGELVEREAPGSLDSVVARSVLRRLLSALQYRDAATLMHSRRVALLAVGMAQHLGWEARHLRVLEVAGLLHDFGKIGVPDNILHKPAKLSSDEAELIAISHNIGVDVLQACRIDTEVVQIVTDAQASCEAPDDCRSLGDELHVGARILVVADAYDSLTHAQVFREAKSHEEAIAVLRQDAGARFDANIVNALSRWVESEGVPSSMDHAHVGTVTHAGNAADEEAARQAVALCQIFSHLYVLESLYDGFYVLDSDLKFALWNRGICELLGRSASQMLGCPWSSRTIATSTPAGERIADHECQVRQVVQTGQPACQRVQVQQKSGPWIEVELQTLPLKDSQGNVLGVVEIFRDVSRSKRNAPQYRELKLAASRDALTGVANRGEMEKRLAQMFEEHNPRTDDPFSVIFLDIDHFKPINDTHGHGVGDRVLIAVARLMQAELYSGELVARYGGEEFVVLCPSTDLESAIRKAERLRTALADTTIGDQPRIAVTASLGVSQVDPVDTPEQLLHRADTALYNAKEAGRNRTCSLSANDVSAAKSSQSQPSQASSDSIFRGSFTTVMMPEMAVYKVSGFVSETEAKVVKVSPERVALQVGRGGLLGGWGAQQHRQPVHLLLEFTEPEDAPTKSSARRVLVKVTITPVGRPPSAAVFQKRGKYVLELLRCHFAAD